MALQRKPLEHPQEPGYPTVAAYADQRRKFLYLLGFGLVGVAGCGESAKVTPTGQGPIPPAQPQTNTAQGSVQPPVKSPGLLPAPANQPVEPKARLRGDVAAPKVEPPARTAGVPPAPANQPVAPKARLRGDVAPVQPAIPRERIKGEVSRPQPPAEPQVPLGGAPPPPRPTAESGK